MSAMATLSDSDVEAEGHAFGGRKVLVAEDSPTTHEILKLLLSQHGHHVDIATDGEEALAALRRERYDVALLDFHLPKMDGLQVATTIRRELPSGDLPRLIAITADLEGLLAHEEGCENFDLVVPKPLDIFHIGQLLEEQAEIREDERIERVESEQFSKSGAHGAGTAFRQPLQGLAYDFLLWPEDVDGRHLSSRAMQATLGDLRFDAIVMTRPVSMEGLAGLWERKALYALPIVDLTGTLGRMADIDGSKASALGSEHLGRLVRDFHSRRARLHRDLLLSEHRGEQLIGRLFVSNRPLTAAYDARRRPLISYDITLGSRSVTREAEALCEQGLLKRSFFDRFHICPSCDSFRLHVREECVRCRSANLSEEEYLHHFRCAFQGKESDFRRGNDLICPKCRHELSHFGFDYDRPGTMVVCRDCGHAASDPSIGFVCLDCGAHTDSDVAATRDVFSYSLTDRGMGFAERGGAALGHARQVLRFADQPLDLVVALNAAARKYNEDKTPFTLLNILYQNESEIVGEHGAKRFSQARDLFIENLRAALGKGNTVVRGQSYDFALLEGMAPKETEQGLQSLNKKASHAIWCDLGAKFQTFGPEDFS